MNYVLHVFLITLVALGLYACGDEKKPVITETNELEKSARSYNLPALLSLNEEGTVIVLNANTGEKAQPCVPQNQSTQSANVKGLNKVCQIEIREEDGKVIVLRDGKEDPTAKATKIISVAYKGSHCVAHKAGTQYEICWPW